MEKDDDKIIRPSIFQVIEGSAKKAFGILHEPSYYLDARSLMRIIGSSSIHRAYNEISPEATHFEWKFAFDKDGKLSGVWVTLFNEEKRNKKNE